MPKRIKQVVKIDLPTGRRKSVTPNSDKDGSLWNTFHQQMNNAGKKRKGVMSALAVKRKIPGKKTLYKCPQLLLIS